MTLQLMQIMFVRVAIQSFSPQFSINSSISSAVRGNWYEKIYIELKWVWDGRLFFWKYFIGFPVKILDIFIAEWYENISKDSQTTA